MLRFLLIGWLAAGSVLSSLAGALAPDSLGLQLFSLRKLAAQDTPAALDQARAFGLTRLEIAGTGKLSVEEFVRAARERGLQIVGAHLPIARLRSDLPGAVAEAKALGVAYVLFSIPPPLMLQLRDEAAVIAIAEEANRWGRAFRAAGVRLGYHTHGGEFGRCNAAGDTVFDVFARATEPEAVTLQMDVFWVFTAGQDPVRLLRKFPGRWELMHLKDLRRGVPIGPGAAHAKAADNVPLGQGQIDWTATLKAAREAGIRQYFIEDESASPVENIPQTIRYLEGLRL